MLKGFRGNLNDELINNYLRNIITTVIIWTLAYFFIVK